MHGMECNDEEQYFLQLKEEVVREINPSPLGCAESPSISKQGFDITATESCCKQLGEA